MSDRGLLNHMALSLVMRITHLFAVDFAHDGDKIGNKTVGRMPRCEADDGFCGTVTHAASWL